MVTTRNPINRPPRSRVTPQARALFNRAMEIESCGDHDFWEEDGGRRREYLDIGVELHQLVGLQPWQISPLDVSGERPDWQHAGDWKQAAELRRALS